MKTRGGIFLLLLAILFVGSGCGAVRAYNAEPYGRHGRIIIEMNASDQPSTEKKTEEKKEEKKIKIDKVENLDYRDAKKERKNRSGATGKNAMKKKKKKDFSCACAAPVSGVSKKVETVATCTCSDLGKLLNMCSCSTKNKEGGKR